MCAPSMLLTDGSACTGGTQCNSGYCIDGVCCNTSCYETCKTCNLPGSVGVCSPHSASACNVCSGILEIPTIPGTGARYSSLESGDFDNDGVIDIAEYYAGVVTLMKGLGNGMFSQHSVTTVGTSFGVVAAGDLNSDGTLDLIATHTDVTGFTVLLNQGDGSFALGTTYAVPLGYMGEATIADLDADGILDVATTNYGVSGNFPMTVSAFLGNGDGTFAARVDSSTGSASPEAIVAADMTGDGIIDLAFTAASFSVKYVHVYRGIGDGTFVFNDDFMFSNPNGDAFRCHLVAGQFNGDSQMDIAVSTDAWNYGEIDVYFNLGSGVYGTPYSTTVPLIPASLTSGDMNGDGKVDLIATGSDRADGFSVLFNGGSGTFTNTFFRTSASSTYGEPVDVDLDGDKDIVLSNQIGLVSMLNPGNGTFEYDASTSNDRNVKLADLNGDGKLDLVRTNGGISVQLNQGNNTFAAKVSYSTATSVELVDVNGDAKPDLLMPNGSVVEVRFNNGNGTFAAASTYATAGGSAYVAAADLTGDGKADLAVVNTSANSLSILRNNGNGTFAAKVDYPTAASPGKVVAADMSGDNILDLVVGADNNRNIDVAYNQGNGTFALADFTTSAADYTDYLVKDLTGDGKADFAIFDGNPSNYVIAVKVNQGGGTFSAAINQSVAYMAYSPAISLEARDIEGDGKPDICVYALTMASFGLTSGTMSVLFNRGNGAFGSQSDYLVATRAVADFNNDGIMDVLRVDASNATLKYGVCAP